MTVLGGLLNEIGQSLSTAIVRAARNAHARVRWGRNLPRLASHYGTDKWGSHWYARHYQNHFSHFRRQPLRILEIGVGGFGDPRQGGESLRMWKAYFPNARIYGLDVVDKRAHDESRITTVMGSQVDEQLLQRLSQSAGPFNIIIDDGSHINAHVVRSFEILFPLLHETGIYVVEDLQTAYWPQYGGAGPDDATAPTSMQYFKRLVDGLNHREFPRGPVFEPGYLERHIVAMHFYHNIVFIQKGLNDEPSNIQDRD